MRLTQHFASWEKVGMPDEKLLSEQGVTDGASDYPFRWQVRSCTDQAQCDLSHTNLWTRHSSTLTASSSQPGVSLCLNRLPELLATSQHPSLLGTLNTLIQIPISHPSCSCCPPSCPAPWSSLCRSEDSLEESVIS